MRNKMQARALGIALQLSWYADSYGRPSRWHSARRQAVALTAAMGTVSNSLSLTVAGPFLYLPSLLK